MLMKDGQVCFSGMPEEVLTKSSIEDAFGIEAEVTKEQNSPYVIPKFV
jgi:ABC-type cobalamin/Fe3+-siderophores transport system ATPase subunit